MNDRTGKTTDRLRAINNEGAVAYDLSELLPNQRAAARRIVLDVQRIAAKEDERRLTFATADEYQWEQWGRRPQNVFFLDGARGSGKTFVLMSILNLVRQLGRGTTIISRTPLGRIQEELIGRSIASLQALQKELDKHATDDKPAVQLHKLPRSKRTAIVLPTIFPVDTEGAGACMEVVFASIERRLKRESEKPAGCGMDKKKVNTLKDKLVQVMRHWAFSRNLGLEAILGDSINYDEFVKKRANQSTASNLRVDDWRAFINEFCDAFESSLLVIGVDDTDVRPELTVDILHSLRIYLDHPRIVTVLAGNLRAMRQSLVYAKFAELRSSATTIRDNPKTLKDWRRFEREEIEQYLEKVLPRWRRSFVGPSDARTSQSAADADFRMLFGRTVDEVCRGMLDHYRDGYIVGRVLAAYQYQQYLHDRLIRMGKPADPQARDNNGHAETTVLKWDAATRAVSENFVAWWLFRHFYADRLRPSTMRQLMSLKHYVQHLLPGRSHEDGTASTRAVEESRLRLRNERTKRLSVMIFESADNFLLTQRFDDNDKVITDWLCRQKVSARWTDRRWIKINGRRLPEGSYSYEAICFRMDLLFARPIRFHEDNLIPYGLLPRPAGVRSVAPFYGPRSLSDVPYFGVAASLQHAAIPRNCTFISDLRVLPVASFLPETGARTRRSTTWESSAVQDLPTLFGNDPRGKLMAYLHYAVAPALAASLPRHSQASWLCDFDECSLYGEFKGWENRSRRAPSNAQPSEETIARALAMFTSVRYAWSATVVFINALEQSINHGKIIDQAEEPAETDSGDTDRRNAEARGLVVRGTLSQYMERERYMMLDYSWLKEALGIVPWLHDKVLLVDHDATSDENIVGAGEAARPRKSVPTRRSAQTRSTKPAMQDALAEKQRKLALLSSHLGIFCSDKNWLNEPKLLTADDFGKIAELVQERLFDDGEEGVTGARKSRALRHLLMYIIGLHTSLPALIHAEIASSIGIGQPYWRINDKKGEELSAKRLADVRHNDAREICDRWRNFVIGASTLVTRLEIDAARALLNAVLLVDQQQPEEHKVPIESHFSYEAWQFVCRTRSPELPSRRPKFTFAPDISVSTLFGEPKETADALTRSALPGIVADSLTFKGLFAQARTNLWLAARFIDSAETALAKLRQHEPGGTGAAHE